MKKRSQNLRRGVYLGICLFVVLLLTSPTACGTAPTPVQKKVEPALKENSCPGARSAPIPLPGVRPEHRTEAFWIKHLGDSLDLDQELLGLDDVLSHNSALQLPVNGAVLGQRNLGKTIEWDVVAESVQTRLDYMWAKVQKDELVNEGGLPLTEAQKAPLQSDAVLDQNEARHHIVLGPVQIRCAPYQGSLHRTTGFTKTDRNACSRTRAQEVVLVYGSWPNGMLLVRTSYAMGWIPAKTPMSQALPKSLLQPWFSGLKMRLAQDLHVQADEPALLTQGTLVPFDPDDAQSLLYADATGIHSIKHPKDFESPTTARPFTRANLLSAAFRYLGTPYGLGGQNQGRDCSRFLMDLFAEFGLSLPRYSGHQAQAGTFSVDLSAVESEQDRASLIREAQQRGVVLLHAPGHIMLYLGETDEGHMVLHGLPEYLSSCSAKDEFTWNVGQIEVSTLQLGRNSSRRAYIERLDRIVVLGAPPGIRLHGVAKLRQPAPVVTPDSCEAGKLHRAIVVSPKTPVAGEEVRVMTTSPTDPGPIQMLAVGPDGISHSISFKRYGPLPYGVVGRFTPAMAGPWKIYAGDGLKTLACAHFVVAQNRPAARPTASRSGWPTTRAWDQDMEALFSVFVEALLGHAPDPSETWPNLHVLLRDPGKNILFNHQGVREEHAFELQPDCADLPFYLRAYFSWKMGLPFVFRDCSRGRAGRPPRCTKTNDNLIRTPGRRKSSWQRFNYIVKKKIANVVHSASGRTAPQDNGTDLYPVDLSREALLPGTVYADPYGHLMIIARWIPQTVQSYGVLLAVDAQPDGTIGQRRFWPGTFLFTPETKDVGAGFKRFRPITKKNRRDTQVPNTALKGSNGNAAFDLSQYEGSKQRFYDRMDALINPRRLEPLGRMAYLVDALHESVMRRVKSVDNATRFLNETGHRVIKMPKGYSIFETKGPWEDFSTPSRDMRLLIALDTVLDFPDSVARAPERYGLSPKSAKALLPELNKALESALKEKKITYIGSNQDARELSLKDIVDRMSDFEMAYNPNDCIEIRWAEPQSSPFRAACSRRAPQRQSDRMKRYRPWFTNRTRPNR